MQSPFHLVLMVSLIVHQKNKFYIATPSTSEEGFFRLSMPPRAQGLKSSDDENKKIIIWEDRFSEGDYLFLI